MVKTYCEVLPFLMWSEDHCEHPWPRWVRCFTTTLPFIW